MNGLVAVTGATGFLGRYIIRELIQNGWRVRVLARTYPVHEQFSDLKFEAVPGDLSNPSALRALVRGADRIVHVAGLIKARDAGDFYRVNVQGTANLVEAVNASASAVRLVLVSSMAAREPHLSPYAASKNAAEEIVRNRLAPRHEWMIIRPCAVYGPWDRETLALLRAVSLGVAPSPGGREARVSLVHVRDAAAAAALLCSGGQAGSQFEITDARHAGYAWEEIIRAASLALGVRPLPLALPAWVVRLVGGMGSAWSQASSTPAMLTMGKAREILHPDWSSSGLRQPPPALWQPKIGLNCGFLETIAWYQTRGWLPRSGKSKGPD
jgi:2-alkyl-3-oxoalkanoate reductase